MTKIIESLVPTLQGNVAISL